MTLLYNTNLDEEGRPDDIYNRHLAKTHALNARHLSDKLNIDFKVNRDDGMMLFMTIFQNLMRLRVLQRSSAANENENENENENDHEVEGEVEGENENDDNNAHAHTRSIENRLESFDRSGPASAFRAHRMQMPLAVYCRRSCWRQMPPALTL